MQETYGLKLVESKFRRKILRYKKHGISGIQSSKTNNHYSQEFKQATVEEYFISDQTIVGIARKYNIPSDATVGNWIIKYTKGEENRNYSPLPEVFKMKSRKTTTEEKIMIVKDCLANELSYKETAQKHHVSYNNVYSWVKKYKEYGPDGLSDNRGRRKPDSLQTNEEKLKAEIAALKARKRVLRNRKCSNKKAERSGKRVDVTQTRYEV
ncbi:transposase [Carnobacterium sp. PL12RED10]|uniref:helix-turn-helix domain-containing protein n=1 Tax=Carnobacterium sp. PL12RED10 TaxID=2592351 RepID=UPI0011ECC570|nr:transposase [Carnobacterium sp. PL12RED10]KAF3302730.1 transposase [Carnobacterium sp. PL12RED10]